MHDLDVFISAHSFSEEDVRDKTVVMIDVLRASSTITVALGNGAKGVIPVADMDAARRLTENTNGNNYLLSGEQNGIQIEGYHLTNSPIAHAAEVVRGRTVILNTTNGTKALHKSRMASEVLVGSFLNLDTVVNHLKQIQNSVVLVCAGWRGRLALEDLLCAGNIISELNRKIANTGTDGAKVAFGLFEKFGDDIEQAVKSSNYTERLKDIVSEDDVTFCSQRSITQVLPVMNEGIITDSHGKEN